MHEFFLFVILVTAIGCSVPLMKIWVNRQPPGLDDEDLEALHQELARMRDRVETLEKIVTDEKYALSRELESL